MEGILEQYKSEVDRELTDILAYWLTFTLDHRNGGFVGRIGHDEALDPEASKGSVLNSRILWSFSAAYILTRKKEYLLAAERAFQYISDFFLDGEYGGVYWTVNDKGEPLETKKQIYALAFAIYGCSEYHMATKSKEAREAAIQLYRAIVTHSHDHVHGGYFEALTREWKEMGDLRLSQKDANERKSMNTHLHVLEGFANLYRIWPDEELKERIIELVRIFLEHIISPSDQHLRLFFDDEWRSKSGIISFGHDIEAAWLIQEAVEIIGDKSLSKQIKEKSVSLADAAAKGLDGDGGLWYEYNINTSHLIKEKHWWPQAEAMVGFFNAWQINNDDRYLQQSIASWNFVKQYIRDSMRGEWVWGVREDNSVMANEDKVGLWKCPYHNSRACMEVSRRISALTEITKSPLSNIASINKESAI